VLEGLAILRAVQLWAPKLQGKVLVIRSDSAVALAMSSKLASPNRILNYLAAELALALEKAEVPKLIPQHIPGSLNKEADWLSRLHQRGEVPQVLKTIKIRRTTALTDKGMGSKPPGVEGSPWKANLPHPQGVFDML
jgi:hypothetical protein